MEVYIEYVIIDNFIIDMLILLFTSNVLGGRINKFRLFLSTVVGVTGAIIMPFVLLPGVLMFLVKIFTGVIMVLLLKKYSSFREFFTYFIMFFTFTFVFGGLCYGLCLLLGNSTLGVLVNAYQFPMGLIVLIISVYLYLLWKLLIYVRTKNNNITLYRDIILKIGTSKHYIRGYVDSGNTIYDDTRPVVVVSFSAFCKMFKQFPYQNLVLSRLDKLPVKNAHYLNFSTASGEDKMLVFDIDELSYKNCDNKDKVVTNVCIGVAKTSFNSDFDCLLHSEFLKG